MVDSAEYQLVGFSNNDTGVVVEDSVPLKKCISLVDLANNINPFMTEAVII